MHRSTRGACGQRKRERDTHILSFSRAGKFLSQIGRPGQSGGSHNTAHVSQATQMRVDARSNEIYVSDGETNRNHRVIVFDSETGAYKRHWGAYGEKPDDAAAAAKADPAAPLPRQFGNAVHCLRIDRDGLVYVCDEATAGSRSSARTAAFRRRSSFRGASSGRNGGRHRFLTRSDLPVRRRWRESESVGPSARSTARGRVVRRARHRAGSSPRLCTIDGRLQGERVHGRGGHAQAACRNSCASSQKEVDPTDNAGVASRKCPFKISAVIRKRGCQCVIGETSESASLWIMILLASAVDAAEAAQIAGSIVGRVTDKVAGVPSRRHRDGHESALQLPQVADVTDARVTTAFKTPLPWHL